MSRDRDRQRVYAAENSVFEETLFTEPLGVTGVVELAGLIGEDLWWADNGVRFEVRPARRESQHSSATLDTPISRIRLSLHQEDAATFAHELAHLLAAFHGPGAGHGPLFRSAAIDVVALVCGSVVSERLVRAFERDGLATAPRRWDPPAGSGERGLYGRWRITRLTAMPS